MLFACSVTIIYLYLYTRCAAAASAAYVTVTFNFIKSWTNSVDPWANTSDPRCIQLWEDAFMITFNYKSLIKHVFHISSIVLVPWFSCLGGYLSVPDDYPLVLGCDEHVSSSCLRSLVVRALEQ